MVRVTWSADAVASLNRIVDYIELHDPDAADRIGRDLVAAAESLAYFPNRGRRVGRNVRELVSIRPYVIRYRVAADIVVVRWVKHGASLRNPAP